MAPRRNRHGFPAERARDPGLATTASWLTDSPASHSQRFSLTLRTGTRRITRAQGPSSTHLVGISGSPATPMRARAHHADPDVSAWRSLRPCRQSCMVWPWAGSGAGEGAGCSGLRVAHLVADRRRQALFCVARSCSASVFSLVRPHSCRSAGGPGVHGMQEVRGSNPRSSTAGQRNEPNVSSSGFGELVALSGSSLHQVSRADQRALPFAG